MPFRNRSLRRVAAYVWASPNTACGVAIGLLLGGRFRRVDGVFEVDGRRVAATLRRLPHPACALTMGHVVFGQNRFVLRVTRAHERAHVAQYERWGVFFLPAYLGCSLWLLVTRRDPYHGNPFETQAYRIDTPDFRFQRPEAGELN